MLEDAGTVTETARPKAETVAFTEIAGTLKGFPAWAASDLGTLHGVETVELVRLNAGETLTAPGESPLRYTVVLDGKLKADRPEQDGTMTTVGYSVAGGGFGETPIMHGKTSSTFVVTAVEPSTVARFSEEQFWSLMACCPAIRAGIAKDMTERLQAYQVEALHREKLVTLGTLAAGLMHELHNPGAAAKRSAALLRENLVRLQEVALRISARPKTSASAHAAV